MLPAASCKIKDATDTSKDGVSIGVPRPPTALVGAATGRVLVIPHSYSDIPFVADLEVFINRAFGRADSFFREQSYGRLNVEVTVPDRSKWIVIDQKWEDWKSAHNGDLASITGAVLARADGIDLYGYNAIYVVTSKSRLYYGGGTDSTYPTPKGAVGNVYFTVGGTEIEPEHNLGHALLHFEDLYIHPWNVASSVYSTNFPLAYDIMGGGSRDFSGWHRWITGWLDESDIACLSPSRPDATVLLQHLERSQGKRLIVIPVGSGRAVLAEYRSSLRTKSSGLWLYWLDSTIGHGFGPMEGGPELITVGGVRDFHGYRFTVVAATDTGLFVRVTSS